MVYLVILSFQGGGTLALRVFQQGELALTDTEIKRAKGADEAYRMPDAGGLYLWITPSGGKLWRWKYRSNGSEEGRQDC